jgi:hypothetical protein
MFAMSLTIQDFRVGAFFPGRGRGHSAAWAQHTRACLDAISAQLLRSPFYACCGSRSTSLGWLTKAARQPVEAPVNNLCPTILAQLLVSTTHQQEQ